MQINYSCKYCDYQVVVRQTTQITLFTPIFTMFLNCIVLS